MQKIINFFRGSLTLTVTGAFPERFINLCAQSGVGFWDLHWENAHTLTLRVARKDRARLRPLAERVQCELSAGRRAGVPYFLARFRKRYTLLLGLALSVAVVLVLSRFILTIEVTGNQRVSTADILSQLEVQGLRLGTYGPAVNERVVSNAALLELPELSWMAVNLHGSRAEVIVREKQPALPVADRSRPSHVLATASGILTRVEALEGEPVFQVGDTVLEGEILISGVMDLREPAWSQTDLGVRVVHAMGSVWARTFRTLRAEIPLEAQTKRLTGEEEHRVSLTILGRRFNFYRNSGISIEQYDKIVSTHNLTLPGGRVMPLALAVETARAYETVPMPLDQGAAETLLQTHLLARLEALMGADGQIIRTEYVSAIQDGVLTVTLTAECNEQIGRVVEFAGELGVNPPGAPGAVTATKERS